MTQSAAAPLPTPKERRRLREAQSLTQAQLAARLGVTRETVRAWESGRTSPGGRKRETYAKLLTSPGPAPALVKRPKAQVSRAERVQEPEQRTQPEKRRQPESQSAEQPLTRAPAVAFDALYTHAAPLLVRQTYLLSGRRALARESVERAFQLAWQRWPEVAVDPDPVGWVRAAAYEYAMSPWHRLRPAHRHPDAPPADAEDRKLLDVLQSLPPVYRRTLLLYDWVGLDLPETAAETEASTPAAANRILHAREAVAEQLPELAVPEQLHRRLTELAGAEKLDAPKATFVRDVGEKRTRFWTRAAIVVTTLIVGATALTVRAAPTHYVPVPAPGAPVSGVPALTGPDRLTPQDLQLRGQLRAKLSGGPGRLAPVAE
ncbi:helix-turn-helix domain-containing protein [Streptomyces kunmingensis]|uniref:Helix-turn-helix domain-containing protein n=1 Tax=Streptomyces kunmingensis TaxID=68225 RepID=A0ABU6CP74_9ACTN|nr:sigma factor-like helix-turn-helix DNA-binding protein [Streptomyces kunmingensis]MEB3966462.1 helix-turn-helix domain-containing protein [Streptomyces kunmingensis]